MRNSMAYGKMAAVYDRLMDDMPYAEWVSLAQEAWNHYCIHPCHIVDLGCGTGNITMPLASSGYRITGIDISEEMLAIAACKGEIAFGKSPRSLLTWSRQDMRKWTLPDQVDSVISFCDCFSYLLKEEELLETFRRCFEGLQSGGALLFDVHTIRQFEDYMEEQPFMLDDEDVSYIWSSEYDGAKGLITHNLSLFVRKEGARGEQQKEHGALPLYVKITETHRQRAYRTDWILQALRQTGFVNLLLGGDFEWGSYSEETRRLFVAAQKP